MTSPSEESLRQTECRAMQKTGAKLQCRSLADNVWLLHIGMVPVTSLQSVAKLQGMQQVAAEPFSRVVGNVACLNDALTHTQTNLQLCVQEHIRPKMPPNGPRGKVP